MTLIFIVVIAAAVKANKTENTQRTQTSTTQKNSVPPDTKQTEQVDQTAFYDSDSSGNYEIYQMQTNGKGDAEQITNNSQFDSWWPRVSPDNKTLLFYRTPKGVHDTDYSQTSLWARDLDTGKESELIANKEYGWDQHGHADWAPDGVHVAMFAGSTSNPQIWMTDNEGKNPQELTHDGGVNLDPSWSTDGKKLVYVGCPQNVCFPKDQEIYVLPIAAGKRTRLTQDSLRDQDPYFAPNDSEIAILTETSDPSGEKIFGEWNIRFINPQNGEVNAQTDYQAITSLPTWSADGKHVYTHQLSYGTRNKFDLVKIKRNDLTLTTFLGSPHSEEFISLGSH